MTKSDKLLVLFDFYMHVKFGNGNQDVCPFYDDFDSANLDCIDLCGVFFKECVFDIGSSLNSSVRTACLCPCVEYGKNRAMARLREVFILGGMIDDERQ